MTVLQILFFGLVAVTLTGLSYQRLSRQNYKVDKASPNGLYRVRVEIRVQPEDKLLGGFNEWGKIQFFKGKEVINTNKWQRKDNFEPTFIDANPIIEWVGDNVLRMGDDRSDQLFSDDLIVSNKTAESLKHVGFSYGKHEHFDVLEIAPGSNISLRASPRFKPDGSSNYFLGYGGETQSGKKFEGVMEQGQRKSSADGPLTFQIAINAKDLK